MGVGGWPFLDNTQEWPSCPYGLLRGPPKTAAPRECAATRRRIRPSAHTAPRPTSPAPQRAPNCSPCMLSPATSRCGCLVRSEADAVPASPSEPSSATPLKPVNCRPFRHPIHYTLPLKDLHHPVNEAVIALIPITPVPPECRHSPLPPFSTLKEEFVSFNRVPPIKHPANFREYTPRNNIFTIAHIFTHPHPLLNHEFRAEHEDEIRDQQIPIERTNLFHLSWKFHPQAPLHDRKVTLRTYRGRAQNLLQALQ